MIEEVDTDFNPTRIEDNSGLKMNKSRSDFHLAPGDIDK